MRDTCFLVMDADGIVSMAKRTPRLKGGQHAVRVSVSVADKYFEHAIPTADLTITEKHIISPRIEVALSEAPQ